MNKAFFFDRDGIINHNIYRYDKEYKKMLNGSPFNISELKINPNIKKIIDYVKEKGYIPIIITNQSIFLKNNLPLKDYEEITTKICFELGIERSQVFECLHKEPFSLECKCRKPKPGLILMAKGMFDLNLDESWLVGDSWKDVLAGQNAGIKNTVFLKRGPLQEIQAGNLEELEKMQEMNSKPKYIINDIMEILNLI